MAPPTGLEKEEIRLNELRKLMGITQTREEPVKLNELHAQTYRKIIDDMKAKTDEICFMLELRSIILSRHRI
jgi:hypothetical protein